MKIKLHSPLEDVQIQIIPLIDVVFCVLTFFILAALQFTRQQAISVDLPKASTGTTTPQVRQMLIVSLDSNGQTYVEKQAVKSDQLLQVLQNYHQTNPNGLMVLNASRSVSYDQVVEVLDLLRQVGGDRVALSTLPAPSDQSPATASTPTSIPLPSTASPNPYPSLTTPRQSSSGINPINPGIVSPNTATPRQTTPKR